MNYEEEYKKLVVRIKGLEQRTFKHLKQLDYDVERAFASGEYSAAHGKWFAFAHDTFQHLNYLANIYLDCEDKMSKEG